MGDILMSNNHLSKAPQYATLNDAGIIREMIRHENELLNHRLSWLCQIQGFLFAALAFAWKDPTAGQIIFLICLIGALVAASSYYGLNRVEMAVASLRIWWENNKAPDYFGPDIIGRSPDKKSIPFLRPWTFLPTLFFVAWTLIAYFKLTDP